MRCQTKTGGRHEDRPPVQVEDEKLLFGLIRAAFGQRRKTLVNSVSHDAALCLDKETLLEALRQMGLSETIRGEALDLKQFAELTRILQEARHG